MRISCEETGFVWSEIFGHVRSLTYVFCLNESGDVTSLQSWILSDSSSVPLQLCALEWF